MPHQHRRAALVKIGLQQRQRLVDAKPPASEASSAPWSRPEFGGATAPVLEQTGPQAVRAEPDQRRQIEVFVHDITDRIERVQTVYRVVGKAAGSDPDAAALHKAMLDQRYANLRHLVGWIETNGPLKDGLSHDDATATVWTLTSPEIFRLLRTERGWSKGRYRRWMTNSLIQLLLP